ncbi:hypothetical protein D3C76_997010 [compost metagenome]
MVTTIAQPVWNRETISPSIPLKNSSRPEKIPQPGHAPWPGAIRLGFLVKARSGGTFTFSLPEASSLVTVIRPVLRSSNFIGFNTRFIFLSGSPGVCP